ncbi:DUF4382 domain-containing protein [Colwellia psychrerythraea]|uniref:Putative lipoprotein n=1 Tax=Colwellia psychrerythraea (strain 34H / ATCC BAA-681) TaxID=167879 RepID=Q487S8_COLP3|nr:DUF4382 domain-containing protein [Colwellia psychrerythraea]AAZ24373.1 putative lipoprotein [Colwellia psychrerythraea 34H]
MLNKIPLTSLVLASLLLSACGGSDKQDLVLDKELEQAKFSLGMSDAPVEEAEVVAIEIDSIKLTNTDDNNGKQEVLIEEFTNEDGDIVDTIQVNLLDFTGIAQMKIVDEAQGITLATGVYTMELVVVDAGSYVILDNDATEYDIKVPSSRLKLGEFTVHSDAVQVDNKPAYTIEFDLTKSLVLRGNDPAKNGYIIKPHGVRIVSLYGDITGTVSAENTNLGPCMVYLYDEAPTTLADLFDSNDESFIGEIPTAIEPLAATTVAVDGNYSIGFVPEGDYTVALRCNTEVDDNVQYDQLVIPSPEGNSQAVNVSAGNTNEVNF